MCVCVFFLCIHVCVLADWQVTVTPAFHTRTRGQSAQFTCSVSDVGAQVQYQWTRSGEKGIPNLASSLGARLTLTGLREEDTGEYCCSATVGGETSQSCAELLVGEYNNSAGSDSRLQCTHRASPALFRQSIPNVLGCVTSAVQELVSYMGKTFHVLVLNLCIIVLVSLLDQYYH